LLALETIKEPITTIDINIPEIRKSGHKNERIIDSIV
ncbi:MAG: hypothetical protein ACI9IA_002268, partial [Enterobacterales bacterium]